jgi:hypothetical protein
MFYLLPLIILSLTACDSAGGPSPSAQSPQQSVQSPRQQSARGCSSGSLELELTPSRPSITLGEPAVILVSLRNCSRDAVEVPANIEPEYSALQLAVSPPDGKTFRYAPPVTRETRRRLTILLPPNATHGAVVHGYLHRSGWLLKSAGVYTFNARLNAGKATIEAPAVQLRVRPAPSGVTGARLQPIWKALGPALYFQSGVSRAAGTLGETARDTRLAYLDPFVRVAGLLARSQPAYDPRSDRFVMSQCSDSAAQAAKIVSAVPDPYFAAVAASRLRTCLLQTGKDAEARELIRQVRTAHPQLAAHPEMAKLLDGATSAPQAK